MQPLNNPCAIHKAPKIRLTFGTSFLLYCKNRGYDVDSTAQQYLGDLAEMTDKLDAWPMEDGIERVKAPDGSYRNIPLLKWVPMATRDSATGNYIWIYVGGREKPAAEVDSQLTHSTLWLDRNDFAKEHGLYLNYLMKSRWPPGMGEYSVVLTLEAMCEDLPNTDGFYDVSLGSVGTRSSNGNNYVPGAAVLESQSRSPNGVPKCEHDHPK